MHSYKKEVSGQTRVGKVLLITILTSFLLLIVHANAAAQVVNEELENQVREISHQLRCPTCQAQSVKESEAGLSVNMKNKVRELLIQGKSEDEILKYFEERYGEWILRSPKKEGFNLVLWVTPLILIVVVGLIVVRILWNRSGFRREEQLSPLSAQEKARLEKDLDRFQAE
ncbi:MAG: cytochrome c-type biogenesis protein CcmH [Proteobacteria bacterium]|nr:cytochrome c-type biogenesis protein CcmH [Pseudomonadota bacterium]